ncbi:MAG: GAF domain-containing protein, partial [Anaerolineales bacterium]|nr:GAF domain-containing protein [Anaerolineales bacterium]
MSTKRFAIKQLKTGNLTSTLTVLATLFTIVVEIINPAWTLDSKIVLTLGTSFVALSLLVGILLILWQTWTKARLQHRIILFLSIFIVPTMLIFSWYSVKTQKEDLERALRHKAETAAISGATTVGYLFEKAIASGELTREQVFDRNYQLYWTFDPDGFEWDGEPTTLNKYHTAYDTYTDENWQSLLDAYLNQEDFIFTIPVDINGYLPTHNTRWSSWDGSPATDRSKRIFNDPVGLKAARNTDPVLVQIYPRPGTGETLLDVSAPIYVNGEHWGAFRVGTVLVENQLLAQSAIQSARVRGIATSGLLLILIIIFSLFLSKTISAPFTVLTEFSEKVARGQFDQKVRVSQPVEAKLLADAFNSMTDQIRKLVNDLEEHVANRTDDLRQAGLQIQKRAEQFEAIAQISRTISGIQNIDELLSRIVRMISDYFDFYHVGIFLLDDSREYAVLRAANSAGGQKMLDRGHRLEVGQAGIVGYVTETGNARIALDTGADAVYFDNPDLPETHSEMALPLMADGHVIGALDVQSKSPDAFTQEDVNILSALADQVSTTIHNVRLHAEAQAALVQAEASYRQLTGQAWSDIKNLAPFIGYRFDGTRPEPLAEKTNAKQAKGQDVLSVPVLLRGETIGNLRVNPPSEGYQWSEDEVAIIRATAERVALAAENARLFLESQKRASKEQVIGKISAKLSETSDIERLMKVAVGELRQVLGAS